MSLVPDIVSQEAIDLIIVEEDSSREYYTRHYTHFDWPLGASGPTIGIGYDCGYVSRMEAAMDWDGIVDSATIQHIQAACGIRGEAAHQFVLRVGKSVTISWDQAVKEFMMREVPKWVKRVQNALPNTDHLPPDCLGALLSLSYNRGTGGYNDPGPRFAEMRAIKHHMASLNLKAIPHDIINMRRLWPTGGDLWRRRMHEADLFQKGLSKVSPIVSAGLPPVSSGGTAAQGV